MTVEQIVTLYPESRRPSVEFPPGAKLHIGSYLVEDFSYEVDFIFDTVGGLSGVILARSCRDQWEAKMIVDRLEGLLTLKYSKPVSSKKEPDKSVSIAWLVPEAYVTLEYSPPSPKLNFSIVVVEYYKPVKPTRPAALDRL